MSPDFIDLLSEFSEADVRFLVVGAYAVGAHGHPRATKDLDVWVDATPENAERVLAALVSFGAPLAGIVVSDFAKPGIGLQIGVPPGRIDVLTKITGVDFAEAWPHRQKAQFAEGVVAEVIGLEHLLRNKRASARLQDLADVEALERIAKLREHS